MMRFEFKKSMEYCSQRGETEVPGEQTERLGSLYNNLMNRFQDYRRDQVVSEVQSQLRREPVQSTSSLDPISGKSYLSLLIRG